MLKDYYNSLNAYQRTIKNIVYLSVPFCQEIYKRSTKTLYAEMRKTIWGKEDFFAKELLLARKSAQIFLRQRKAAPKNGTAEKLLNKGIRLLCRWMEQLPLLHCFSSSAELLLQCKGGSRRGQTQCRPGKQWKWKDAGIPSP